MNSLHAVKMVAQGGKYQTLEAMAEKLGMFAGLTYPFV